LVSKATVLSFLFYFYCYLFIIIFILLYFYFYFVLFVFIFILEKRSYFLLRLFFFYFVFRKSFLVLLVHVQCPLCPQLVQIVISSLKGSFVQIKQTSHENPNCPLFKPSPPIIGGGLHIFQEQKP